MAQRRNHYEAALEQFLRQSGIPHVVVDERRRALLEDVSLKSMDFIVYSARRPNLLVDVKGRRFPSGGETSGHRWENWATVDDLTSLLQWQSVFGQDFRALLLFAYHVIDPQELGKIDSPFLCDEKTYGFYGVWADEYRAEMRTRSPSWETVSLPTAIFRTLRAPLAEFL